MATSTSTIVFTDVVGSTATRAALGEEAADLFFRSLERIVGEVVAAHAGRVVKTGGDGVMAAFDSATDAAQACVAVQQRVASAFDDVLLRVGAAAGDVSWESGDCFGMPVVIAARLQGRAEGGQILVSAVVRWLAGDRSGATFTSVGALELAGIPEAVEAFEIPWVADAETETVVLAIPLPPAMGVVPTFPLVGRDRDLAALSAAAAGVGGGGRRTVLVGGEAGAGKTRVAFELARDRHAAGAIVLLGTCDAELGMPYQPWVQILGQLVRALPGDAAANLAPHLAQLTVLLPEIERVVPGIAPPAPADPEPARYRLFQAIDALLAWAASDREMVVVVDDLHWAGTQTLALLRHVARGTDAARIIVVGTFRDTGDEVTDPLASCLADLRRVDTVARIRLGALDLAAVEQFVSEATGQALDSRLRTIAAHLAERSGGNAFYLGELWRHLVERERGDGSDASRVPPGLAGVPESVREVVTARLARLSDFAREMVDLIATAGLRIDVRILRTAFAGVDIGTALDELERARLLVEVAGPPVVYHFAHALVRDTIVEHASSAGRAYRHRRVAEAIERVYEADRRPVLAQLARHYVEAAALGDAERAVYYARRAGTQAMRSHAYEEAIVHLEAAQALSPPGSPEHVQLLLDLGTCHTRSGFDPRAMTLFETAFEAASDLGLVRETASAVLGLSHARALRGLPGAVALDMVAEALRLLGDEDPVLRIRLRAAEARALSLAGRQHEAVDLAWQVLDEARLNGEPVAILAALDCVTIDRGDAARCLGAQLEGARIAEELGELWIYCQFTGGAVGSYIDLGALDEARKQLERVRRASERGRFDMWRYQVANLDSLLAVADGHFDDAERHATLATSLLPATTEFVAGVYGMQMYAVRREQGRLAEVAPVLRMASSLGSAEPLWAPGLAALYAQVGMLDDARSTFDALAAGGFASVPRDVMWPACLALLAEVCIAVDDRVRGVGLYDELATHAGSTLSAPFTVCFGPADRLRGGLAALLGRREEASAHFAAALALAERSASPVWLAHVQHDWAVALGERTDLLEEACATAARLAMRDLEARCRSTLTARQPTPRPSPVASLPAGLSAREVEVLRLVATGRSNRDIGAALFISENTVANHVRSILQKTASANRAEATAYAARKGLLP